MFEKIPFHSYEDFSKQLGLKESGILETPSAKWVTTHVTGIERALTYDFELHQHPFVSDIVQRLVQGSVPSLEEADTAIASQAFFGTYGPKALVEANPPQREVDFGTSGAYSVYN